jgi:Ca-activated chloride channel homolog
VTSDPIGGSVTGRMRTRLAGCTLAAMAAVGAAQTPQTPFRASAQTVAVYATVLDRDGRLVTNLTRADFDVLDNGKPVPLTVFSNDLQPITVAIMLDTSDSMERKFTRVRESTQSFIDQLLPADRARIGTFGDEVAISPILTGDKTVLSRILSEEMWPGGGTPLWSAIDTAMTALSTEEGRRVILTLTDGQNACVEMRGPCKPADPVAARAIDEEFMVYAIGMEGSGLDRTVKVLADRTGGGAFELPQSANLTAAFARVADELHHQYALGFRAAVLDGQVHTVEVRIKKPGLTARARKTYVARPER